MADTFAVWFVVINNGTDIGGLRACEIQTRSAQTPAALIKPIH